MDFWLAIPEGIVKPEAIRSILPANLVSTIGLTVEPHSNAFRGSGLASSIDGGH